MTRNAVFLHSKEIENYHYPPECPFKTHRAALTRKIIDSMGLLSGDGLREVAPVTAPREDLEKIHTAAYLDALVRAGEGRLGSEGFHMGLGTPDCPVFDDVYEYPALATGATLAGARMILAGETRVAFNPSGGYHHALAERAAGFCYINDSALGCYVLAEGGKRVLYLDVDAHHADGVQAAFYNRADVMTISFHESGRTLFPGTGWERDTGVGEGTGYAANVPLPMGVYDEAYLRAFGEIAPPLMEAFDPDVIVMELGMDCLAGDPLTHLTLTNLAYEEVLRRVLDFDRPLLAVGGGGYNPDNTARAWALLWMIMSGQDHPHDAGAGMGGVMLESTDWSGGLRDRALAVDDRRRAAVESALDETVRAVRRNVFPMHRLRL